ncbi:Ferredoxin--NADP reductase [Candidatus Mikella endobia]|uniref:Flavodoxin/ferredoxin--NADP reductase n=1 Tax=Candidatus Mikella endobia TaxID=1778264 RepID=A0A143WR08_9ENTR|nr:ferredoxin--NADP(+) reductase [Candidatus Mikella endobia]CUX96051.1 Ferredoxin--NADP reductase [Candidatus Mikella endobia]
MATWVTGNVVQIKHWRDGLFSLIVHAPIYPFTAGQFTKIGMNINGNKIQRAYSYVNAPQNSNLEFYLIAVPNGKLSQALHKLQSGNQIMITKEAAGLFVLNKIPPCQNLWMIATGTAIGPYLSILEHGKELERFKRIILIYAVRFVHNLNYLPQMLKLQHRYNDKLQIQIIISQEKVPGYLMGRIPTLIANGSLELAVDLNLNAKNSHVMICGNPNMIVDTQQLLNNSRGMRKNSKYNPGHITIENYW